MGTKTYMAQSFQEIKTLHLYKLLKRIPTGNCHLEKNITKSNLSYPVRVAGHKMSASDFDKSKRPKVGVGVFIVRNDKPSCVILGKRRGLSAGCGMFALPGGHLEFGESWEDCARREALEETGLKLLSVEYNGVVNAVDVEKDYHYITIFMKGIIDVSLLKEPQNLEPDKCEGWIWSNWDSFPDESQLFCPLKLYRQLGYTPFPT